MKTVDSGCLRMFELWVTFSYFPILCSFYFMITPYFYNGGGEYVKGTVPKKDLGTHSLNNWTRKIQGTVFRCFPRQPQRPEPTLLPTVLFSLAGKWPQFLPKCELGTQHHDFPLPNPPLPTARRAKAHPRALPVHVLPGMLDHMSNEASMCAPM